MNDSILHFGSFEKTDFHLRIEDSIRAFRSGGADGEALLDAVLEALRDAVTGHQSIILPIELPEGELMDGEDLRVRLLDLPDDRRVFAAFTGPYEVMRGADTSTYIESLEDFLGGVMLSDADGVVLNPWGEMFYLPKEYIELVLKAAIPENTEFTVGFIDADPLEIEVGYHAPQFRASEIGDGAVIFAELEKLRRADIHSAAIPVFAADGSSMEEAVDSALRTFADWIRINRDFGAAICFAGTDEEAVGLFRQRWGKFERNWNEREIVRKDDGRLGAAMGLALELGLSDDEILRAAGILRILSQANADTNLLCAGILLGAVGKSESALYEIYRRFGTDTAALVRAGAAENRRCWYMQKLQGLLKPPEENVRVKLLVMADGLLELRRLSAEKMRLGDEALERGTVPKAMLAWYFGGVIDALNELKGYTETAGLYGEMRSVFGDVFGGGG